MTSSAASNEALDAAGIRFEGPAAETVKTFAQRVCLGAALWTRLSLPIGQCRASCSHRCSECIIFETQNIVLGFQFSWAAHILKRPADAFKAHAESAKYWPSVLFKLLPQFRGRAAWCIDGIKELFSPALQRLLAFE